MPFVCAPKHDALGEPRGSRQKARRLQRALTPRCAVSSNVVTFTGITTVKEPPEQVLEKAKTWGLTHVIIVGANEDGNFVWGGSYSDAESIHFLLECAQAQLIAEALDT